MKERKAALVAQQLAAKFLESGNYVFSAPLSAEALASMMPATAAGAAEEKYFDPDDRGCCFTWIAKMRAGGQSVLTAILFPSWAASAEVHRLEPYSAFGQRHHFESVNIGCSKELAHSDSN